MATLLTTSAFAQPLFDRYFDEYYFPFLPTNGTSAGLHQYDGKLEDYSRLGIVRRVDALKKFEKEFAKLPQSDDRDLVLNSIRADLLELETVRGWERDPDRYSSGITYSAFVIMSRTFASAEVRLKSLIERERLMPRVFADAKVNLRNPPRIFTEVALEQMPGNIEFFQNDVPLAFKTVTDAMLVTDFKAANNAVITAMKDYQQWLKKGLAAPIERRFQTRREDLRKQASL